jgi:putative redox protein
MVKMTIQYKGDLHCDLTHGPSGSRISTDAPKDNMGRGEAFSPTDLVGAALASCIVTTMAIFAKRDGIPFEGARAEVSKEMTPPPRRIGALPVRVILPKSIPESYRAKLEEVAHTCPVHRSLHPDVQLPIEIVYE